MKKPKFIKEIEECEKELVYNTVYLPVRFFKKEAYIRIDDYKEVRNRREKVVEWLEEENRKLSEKVGQLKSDLAFERTMLDNVRAEYESLQNVIKELKEEKKKLQNDLETVSGAYFDR